MAFDGVELLEFAVKSIRNEVNHISVTYQTTSYHGNPAGPELLPTINQLLSEKLIDEAIFYEPDLNLHPQENEVRLRNIGVQASKQAGCTHHISSDVDELYISEQLAYAKKAMEEDDYDFSVAPYLVYYKEPTYQVTPPQNLHISLIHPVDNTYNRHLRYPEYPFHCDLTRRLNRHEKYRTFTREEIEIHHMSFVRKDMRKKFANNLNNRFIKIDKFMDDMDKHQVGGRVCLLPEFLNRKTKLVDNIFGITL